MRLRAFGVCLLLSLLLIVGALAASVHATQYVWSDYFSSFEPNYGAVYDDSTWTEVQNSTLEANVTFTHGIADGTLQLTSHTIIASGTTHHLIYYREVEIEHSMTFECRFCGTGVNSAVVGLLLHGVANWADYVISFTLTGTDGLLKYRKTDSTMAQIVAWSAMNGSLWYTLEISWVASPNHYDVLLYEGDSETAVYNATITDNLHGFNDVSGAVIDIAGKETVDFYRFYVDDMGFGGSFGGSFGSMGGVDINGWLPSIVSLAMVGVVCGMIRKAF